MLCYEVVSYECVDVVMICHLAVRSAGQYSLLHTFNFSLHHPYGVGSVLYQPQHRIIIVAAAGNSKRPSTLCTLLCHSMLKSLCGSILLVYPKFLSFLPLSFDY